MDDLLLRIKHIINKNLGTAIKNVSCYLHNYSKTSKLGSVLYNVNNRILSCVSFVPFEVISHELYAKCHKNSLITPILTNRVGYTSKLTYGLEPLEKELIPVSIADVYVAKHESVSIQGNSDFILNVKERIAINDFCYNMSDRYEMFDGILLRLKNNVAVFRNNGGRRKSKHLKSGIMMSGKFSRNYYHEIYEILVRLLLLDKINIPDDTPLIIDDVVLKIDSFKKIFRALHCSGRDVVTIGEEEVVEFDTLYHISAVNFIAPHYKDITNPNHLLDFVFDYNMISQLRTKLLSFKSDIETPKRIFVTRKNTKLRHYNESEIYEIIKDYGFEIVAPETYDFYEQIALFNNANCIVGGSGAAFTNLLFCHANCKVVCFRSIRNYSPIFSTIANFVGVEMRYLTGVSCNEKDTHADYVISVDELREIIDYNED